MSFSSFFKPGGSQFTSKNTQGADDLLYDKTKGALEGFNAPGNYQVGNSPIGMGNPTFNVMGGWGSDPYAPPAPASTGGGLQAYSSKPSYAGGGMGGAGINSGGGQPGKGGGFLPFSGTSTFADVRGGGQSQSLTLDPNRFRPFTGVSSIAETRGPTRDITMSPQGQGGGGWGGSGAGGPQYSPFRPTKFNFEYQKTGYDPYQFKNTYTPSKFSNTYNPYQFKDQSYSPYKFTMPGALDQKTGLFGQLMGNTNRELLRNQQSAVDNQMRNAVRSGVYSPSMMKNTVLGAQKQSQETMGDIGARSAFDLASEVARYQSDNQARQAAENMAAAEFGNQNQARQAAENQFAATFGFGVDQARAAERASAAKFGFDVDSARAADRFAAAKFGSDENRFLSELMAKQQTSQADENKAWQDLILKGGQLGLEGEKISMAADQGDKDYFTKLLASMGENFIQPYAQRQKTPSQFNQILQSAAGAFCLPLETPIELEDGETKPVQEIKVGDRVKGGEVIKIYSRKRSKDHWFTKHYFKNGAVVTMTMGHPYYDELVRTSPDYDEKSPCTCDILTDSGVYYVNGVKLGSTLGGVTHGSL